MDWKQIIGSVAPGLATALGGPLAGAAVGMLADKVLGGSSGDPVADEAKIAGLVAGGMTPELRARIIDAETSLKIEAMRMGLEEKRIDLEGEKSRLADVAQAREQHSQVVTSDTAPWYIKARQPVLAMLAVLGFLGCLSALLYLTTTGTKIDSGVKDILVYALGCLTSIVMMVYTFDFGTSSGSQGKDQVFAHLLKR